MILSVCSNEWCRQIYGWAELDKPEVVYSHGCCPPCGAAAMDDLNERFRQDEFRRLENSNRACGYAPEMEVDNG